MIKNERQYRITRTQVERLESAAARLEAGEGAEELDPKLVQAQKDALASQLADLRAELGEYETLSSGRAETR